MAQALLNSAEKSLLLSRGIDQKALDRMQPQIVFTFGLGGVGGGTGGGATDPLAIAAGINAADDIDEIIRLLKRAEIENPTLYTDDNGVIFAPEIISNPDTGAVVRNYKTFPGGVPYSPVGNVRELTGQAIATASSAVQPFTRLSDGATVFGTYDPATQTLTPYGSSTPLPAADFEPIDPEELRDHEVIRTAIAIGARSPDYAIGDDLANVMVVGESGALSDVWYNATQNKTIPEPDAADLAVEDNPRIVLGQERIALNYAQAELSTFFQPGVGQQITVVGTLESDQPSSSGFLPGNEVVIVGADGLSVSGLFNVVSGSVAGLNVERQPDSAIALGAQSFYSNLAQVNGAKMISLSRLSPPASAEWAEIEFHASFDLLQLTNSCVGVPGQSATEFSSSAAILLNRRLVAANRSPADLLTDRGIKSYYSDGDRLLLKGDEMTSYRFFSGVPSEDVFATVTYGRGGDL